MSRDPANDARLAREDARRQQFFFEDGARRRAESQREAKKAEEWREHIGRMNAEDLRAKRHAPTYNYITPISSTSNNDLPASSNSQTGRGRQYLNKNRVVGHGAIGGTIKALFFLAALYGAYDSITNQSSIAEFAEKTGRIAYGLSDALGEKIRSGDPNSLYIIVTDDIRWVVGLVVSIDVGLGAGAGNAAVWAIRECAHRIQSTQSAS